MTSLPSILYFLLRNNGMDFVRYMTRVYYICTIIVHYYNMKNNYSKRLMDVIEYSREEAAFCFSDGWCFDLYFHKSKSSIEA